MFLSSDLGRFGLFGPVLQPCRQAPKCFFREVANVSCLLADTPLDAALGAVRELLSRQAFPVVRIDTGVGVRGYVVPTWGL